MNNVCYKQVAALIELEIEDFNFPEPQGYVMGLDLKYMLNGSNIWTGSI
jgi:hypothetical protein